MSETRRAQADEMSDTLYLIRTKWREQLDDRWVSCPFCDAELATFDRTGPGEDDVTETRVPHPPGDCLWNLLSALAQNPEPAP